MPTTTLQDIIEIATICGMHRERAKANKWAAKVAQDEATRARYAAYAVEDDNAFMLYDGFLTAAVARFRNA